MTIDSKAIALIWNFRCNLDTLDNPCIKYERLGQKQLKLSCIQVSSMRDLDLLLKLKLVN